MPRYASRSYLSLITLTLSAVLRLAPASNSAIQKPLVPDTGYDAYRQALTDLAGVHSVLVVALRPGEEDLATMTYLRLRKGFRVSVVYVTSGESMPDTKTEESPNQTAGSRKNEAWEISQRMNWRALFLNFPDPGVVHDTVSLITLWNPDSLSRRLLDGIETEAPDIVLLNFRSALMPTGPPAELVVRSRLLAWMKVHERQRRIYGSPSGNKFAIVQRVLSDGISPTARIEVPSQKIDSLYGNSCDRIAATAATLYTSIVPVEVQQWTSRRAYSVLYARAPGASATIEAGVSILTARVRQLTAEIQKWERELPPKPSRNSLKQLKQMIDTIDIAIRNEAGTFTPEERRLVGRWKRTLEDIRCCAIGLRVYLKFEEPAITTKQLFELSIDSVTSAAVGGITQIYFPRVGPDWIVNAGITRVIDLKPPVTIQILSQSDLTFDLPTSTYGETLRELGTDFLYAIIHYGAKPEENFIYQRQISLRISKPRSFELINDVVSGNPEDFLVMRSVNYTRDPATGTIRLRDTLYETAEKTMVMPYRYSFVTDRMTIRLRHPLPPGSYKAHLSLGLDKLVPFTIQSFVSTIDSGKRIGLLATGQEGALRLALPRLGARWSNIDSSTSERGISDLHVIIVATDYFASAGASVPPGLEQWVANGGHLIICPQTTLPAEASTILRLGMFTLGSPTAPNADPQLDTTNLLLRNPNRLVQDDWTGWHFAKAFGTIVLSHPDGFEIPVRNAHGGALAASTAYGHGRVSFLALNLETQLASVVPGAHRLLANLISR